MSRSYDASFRVATQSVNGAETVDFTHDADDLLTAASIGGATLMLARDAQRGGLVTSTTLGSVSDARTYNDFGELTAMVATDGVRTLFAEEILARDALGRITAKRETIADPAGGPPDVVTYEYGYDLAGRLDTVTRSGTLVADYGYDPNGNRTAGPGLSAAPTYDAQDRLLTYEGASYSYTANGELATKTVGAATTTYEYDALGNLRNVTPPGGSGIEYAVDGQGRRIGRREGALEQGFLYDGQLRVVAELDGAGEVVSRFVYAESPNVPELMVRDEITYRIVTDHLGSPRVIVQTDGTGAGTIAQRLDYDEFGNVTEDTNPGFQPFGFAGGLYDPATEIVRFGARDYDSSIGRWITKDPIRLDGGTNLFGYASEDPINRLDVRGKAAAAAVPAAACLLDPACVAALAIGAKALGDAMAGYLLSEGGEDGGSNEDADEVVDRNPAQDQKLTPGEIKRLKDAGYDPEELKRFGRGLDLFKDKKGNVCVKPKSGKGPGEALGINLKRL